MTTEAEQVASPVWDFLRTKGWETYAEVQIGNRRADIVATCTPAAPMVMVVETKLVLSFDLLDQAARWKPLADFVYIAVPYARETDGRKMAIRIAQRYLMLGVIEVGGPDPILIHEAPVLTRQDDELLHALRPEHRTFARAGSPGGSGHFTPFGGTEQQVVQFVSDNPGCKLEEVVPNIRHHYRTDAFAVEALRKAIRKGQIAGVKFGWKQQLHMEGT